jgi:hypothetical protein
VAYCSDSNGYWRFRRLYDVLNEKKDYRLQVLTHPEWWQEKPMPARQRFFRCVYGRANANMQNYDEGLVLDARVNQAGPAAALRVFRESQLRTYELCDYLWNSGAFQTLFLELWRLHEAQIKCLCTAQLCKAWEIPAAEVNGFFASEALAVDGWRIFEVLFETNWQHAAGMSESAHKDWVKVRNQLIHGRCSLGPSELEQGCVYLCGIVHQLATWGVSQPFAYDGLTDLGSIGIPISETAEGSLEEKLADRLDTLPHHRLKRWRDFLGAMPRLTEY